MSTCDRNYNADYYDIITTQTADIEFYMNFVHPESRVLGSGGNGRVTVRLLERASVVVGVDLSETMLARARASCLEKAPSFTQISRR